jgi:nucleotidyltransferase/DNA polymerase involved in DNA repair
MQVANPGFDAQTISWHDIRIACVWLPRLPLQVEVLRHPDWDGRPLVLASPAGERRVVQICSPEAEQAGIRPGLPLREVLPLCGEAIVLQPDPVHTAMIVKQVLSSLQRVSPAVEAQSDRIFLDLRGLSGVYRDDLSALEAAIRAAVPALLRPRIGVAGGKFPAFAAARMAPPAGLRVVPAGATAAFLAPLPVRYLPAPPALLAQLELLGLRTLANLAALPFASVQAEFGPLGARLWWLANGDDSDPLVPHRFTPAITSSLRFDTPLGSVEAVGVAVRHLLVRSFSDLAFSGHAVRQARLAALLTGGSSWEQFVTFKEPLSSKEAALRAIESKLQLPGVLPAAPIEELSLELIGLGGEAARQAGMFMARGGRMKQLLEVMRQLRALYGYVPLYQVMEVEPWSRIPERRWALVPYDP